MRSALLAAGLAMAIAMTAAAAEAPAVVASIKPVHSLVAAVMGDVGKPALIVEGAGSPHAYALRPSQAAAIAAADVIFWIGPDLEVFLSRPLAALGGTGHAVSLIDSAGLTLLPLRAGGSVDDHGHGHAAATGSGPAPDMHIWLDPDNAIAMTRRIVDHLSAIAPGHAATFRANGAALVKSIAAMDLKLTQQLAGIRGRPFIVFHDAYRYLEDHYRLDAVASFIGGAESSPSARRIADLGAVIRETGAACIFAEPQFASETVSTIAADAAVRIGTLDPLGSGLAPGPDAYLQIMETLARSLLDCLGAAP